MLYCFKPRFEAPILARTKQQTIRKPRTGRLPHAKPSGVVHIDIGSQWKHRRLGVASCILSDIVDLDFKADTRTLHGHTGTDATSRPADLDRFAVMDGFEDWADMRAFWRDVHDATMFRGQRIFWGDTFKAA